MQLKKTASVHGGKKGWIGRRREEARWREWEEKEKM